MKAVRRRAAFTLIEVLIVVVIMAILAATVIPQFSSSTKDAQESSVKFNAHTMQSQIELYKLYHEGKYPSLAKFADQLTKPTNSQGTPGEAGPQYPLGPYMPEIPINAIDNLNTVKAGTGGDGDSTSGWQYDETTGRIWPNHVGYHSTVAAVTAQN
jgi:general secretion pathway protein G